MSNFGPVSGLTSAAVGVAKGLTTKSVYFQSSDTQQLLLRLDCSIREMHTIQAPPSEFPVESGQVITDNFVIKPVDLEIEGMVTDAPVSLGRSAVNAVVSSIAPPGGILIGSGALALYNAIAGSSSPSVQAFQSLLQIISNKTRVDVYTTLNMWKSMWISSLSVPRTSETSNAIIFTAKMRQIILVAPQTVNVVKYTNPGVSAGMANEGKTNPSQNANILNQYFQAGKLIGTQNANGITSLVPGG